MAKIAAPALEKAKLLTKTAMTSVEVQGDEAGSSRKILVRSTNEESHVYEFVVITSPLGWLKRHKETIKPLDSRVARAIDQISVGNLEKAWPLQAILTMVY
jgi:hypothetical protein